MRVPTLQSREEHSLKFFPSECTCSLFQSSGLFSISRFFCSVHVVLFSLSVFVRERASVCVFMCSCLCTLIAPESVLGNLLEIYVCVCESQCVCTCMG